MSAAEKQNKAMERLHNEVAAVLSSDSWKAALAMRSRFHKYSVSNLLLIWSQRPDATYVAGFHKWKEFDRSVNKGEKGIMILAPLIGKSTDPVTGDVESRVYGFRTAYVFDVSQTDGKPLPVVDVPEPLVDDSAESRDLLERLAALTTSKGFTLEFVDSLDGANGSWQPATSTIRIVHANRSAGEQVRTLAHELAHALANHGTMPEYDYALGELEAETAAYLVADALGLSTDAYAFHYLAHFTRDAANFDKLLRAGTVATRVADEITAALTTAVTS